MLREQHTPGPWRWQLNPKARHLHLVGGQPRHYDLTILEPARWGMNNATLMLRDPAHDGMNVMHKLHERPDWIAPFPGRAHHADWCANVVHPDMQLIAAAPDLLAALQAVVRVADRQTVEFDLAHAAIAKATGTTVRYPASGGTDA